MPHSTDQTPTPLWTPSTDRVEASHMHRFMSRVARKYNFPAMWPDLHRWSLTHAAYFWREFFDFAELRALREAECTRVGDGMLDTQWLPGMQLNYADNLLRWRGDELALIGITERGARRALTRDELRDRVARCAAGLAAMGVGQGDRVAGFLPNTVETVVAMLATASRGAIWSSCSPDFGARGVLDRFQQIEPRVLLVTDGYTYNGRRLETISRVREMLPQLPSVQHVVVVPLLDVEPNVATVRGAVLWDAFLESAGSSTTLAFAAVPFDHPLFIMYSSGTTGTPKCIVHGHGGTLLQHMKELMLHTDIRCGDRVMYYTTCGWMMWNWLVSALGVGATAVLYEGSPIHPTVHRLWEVADAERLAVFGTSPKFLAACEKAHLEPGRDHDLGALRTICSTGAPLAPSQFHWVYEHVKADLQLASISGGTDIISCFMLGNPLLPVYAGEIQGLGLGMSVEAWSAAGEAVTDSKGELVCTQPFPSQPIGFWKDADGSRYRAAYFEHFPGVWRHGDLIEINDRGGVIVYGRSDATLNPGGVRIGTAEIYRIVEALPEVADSVVVGLPTDDGDTEIVLFVVLAEASELDDSLQQTIRNEIATSATRRHVPRRIYAVPEIPYTISGKKVELAVLAVVTGQEPGNREALANPRTLDHYRNVRLRDREA